MGLNCGQKYLECFKTPIGEPLILRALFCFYFSSTNSRLRRKKYLFILSQVIYV